MYGANVKITRNVTFVFVGALSVFILSAFSTYLILFFESISSLGRNLILSFLLPGLASVPLLVWICYLRGRVASLRHKVNYLATHDWLTGLPNRAAFSSIVECSGREKPGQAGAFLVVRAGLPTGNCSGNSCNAGIDAVRLTAAAIVSAVRSTDVVGRIGPDHFAIVLWGADREEARRIGCRISRDAGRIVVGAGAAERPLELGVRGCIFQGVPDLDALDEGACERFLEGAVEAVPSIRTKPVEVRDDYPGELTVEPQAIPA